MRRVDYRGRAVWRMRDSHDSSTNWQCCSPLGHQPRMPRSIWMSPRLSRILGLSSHTRR
jgi:hypothetical protein